MAGVGNSGGSGGGAVRAGRAFVELFAEDNKVYRALDRLKGRFQKFAGFTAKAGGALGAAGVTALAPLKPALDSITESSKLGDTAEAFGLTAEKASRLFGIMASGGSDLRDATEGIVTFNQRVSDALSGKGEEAAELFKDLGKSANTFTGDSSDKFFSLLEALRQVPDPAKRVQLLLKAVGEDTGKNLIPLLSMSADQVTELGNAFEQSGTDLKGAREATREYNLAVAEVGKIWRESAAAVIPIVKDLAAQVRTVIKPVGEFVKQNREALRAVVAVGAALAGGGAALIALGGAAGVAATVIGGVVLAAKAVAVAVGLIVSPVGLVIAGFAALGAGLAYLLSQTEAGAGFFGWIKNGFDDVAMYAKVAWGGIGDAIKTGNFKLAGEIALAGLKAAWAQLWLNLDLGWINFKAQFLDGWRDMTDALQLGLQTALLRVIKFVAFALDRVLAEFSTVAGALGLDGLAKSAESARAEVGLYGAAAGVVENELVAAAAARKAARDKARKEEEQAAVNDFAKRIKELGALRLAAQKAVEETLALDQASKFTQAHLAVLFATNAGGARAATVAGSEGSFSAAAASQRFGTQQTQKKLGAIVDNTERTVKAIAQLGNALSFK